MECRGEYIHHGLTCRGDSGFGGVQKFGRSVSRTLVICLFLILPVPVSPGKAFTRAACSPPGAEQFLIDRLNLWQQRLSLEHWKVSIVTSHPSGLRPNTLGNVEWYPDERYALIQVLDAADYKLDCREMLQDMEFTVVHELIHLELSSLSRSEISRRDEEVAVNRIAAALLALDRRR